MSCNCKGPQSDFSLLDGVLAEYADTKGSLIAILQKAQEIYGYLPKDVMYYVAERLDTTPAEVMGVATFYAQFRLQPIGKYLICLAKAPPAMSTLPSVSVPPSARISALATGRLRRTDSLRLSTLLAWAVAHSRPL